MTNLFTRWDSNQSVSAGLDIIPLCDSVDPTRLLLTFNVSVNLGDKYHKNTALHWAVLAGNTTVISLLLDANANVDAQNIKVVPSSRLQSLSVCTCIVILFV